MTNTLRTIELTQTMRVEFNRITKLYEIYDYSMSRCSVGYINASSALRAYELNLIQWNSCPRMK